MSKMTLIQEKHLRENANRGGDLEELARALSEETGLPRTKVKKFLQSLPRAEELEEVQNDKKPETHFQKTVLTTNGDKPLGGAIMTEAASAAADESKKVGRPGVSREERIRKSDHIFVMNPQKPIR
jgi:hypothetical protein